MTDNVRISAMNVLRDYLLDKALIDLAETWPAGTPIYGGDGRPTAFWAFAGGTSLTNAHKIADRYSEDLDLVVVPFDESVSVHRLKKARRLLLNAVGSSIHQTTGDASLRVVGRYSHVTQAVLDVFGIKALLAVDVAVQPVIEDGIAIVGSQSLIGRWSSEEDLAALSELCPHDTPTVAAEVTATNKLAALYRYAATGDYDSLRERARDVYDLGCAAKDEEIAARIGLRVADISRIVTAEGVRRRGHTEVPRPPQGWGSGLGFIAGSEAYRALQRGWHTDAAKMIWGDWVPDFEEAVELAAGLDLG